MNLFVTAGALAALTGVLVGPVSAWLARSPWVTRSPRAAVALWQAIGLSAGTAAIGAGLSVAVARFHAGFWSGFADLLAGVAGGHPLRGLGLPDALGLTLAADLGVVLLCLVGATMVRTVRARARHRRLLNLLAGPAPSHPGTVTLEHPGAVAYCLPGIRPRIVISTGTVHLLGTDELAAVIDHERGHAAERHGLVMLPMGGLSDLFGWIPYARHAPRAVAALLEMAADDHSARRHSPASLASALIRMAQPGVRRGTLPHCSFGAGAIGVPARVARLLSPDRRSRRTAGLAMLGAVALLALPVASLILA